MSVGRQPWAYHVETVPVSRASEFTYFDRLPAELRIMIWDYSLPDPRVYEVLDAPHATQRSQPLAGLIFGDDAQEPPPALAAVCRESRYHVLEHYKPLTLGSTTKYIALSRDILLLEPYLQIQRLNRALHFMSQIPMIRDHINRLALGTSYGIYIGISHPIINWKSAYRVNLAKLLASLAKFPNLQTLIFIIHQEFQFEFNFFPPHQLPTLATQPHAFLHPTGPNTVRTTGYRPFNLGFRSPPPVPKPTATPSSLPAVPGFPSLQPRPSLAQPHPLLPPYGHQQPLPDHIHHANSHKEDKISNTTSRTKSNRRRRHLNELLYYPLDYDEDSDDWGLREEEEEEEGRAWFSTWPTNDDWRRFRRRWVREVGTAGLVRSDERKRRGNEKVGVGGGPGCKRSAVEALGEEERDRKRRKQVKLAAPAIKGASLLWRYSRGGDY